MVQSARARPASSPNPKISIKSSSSPYLAGFSSFIFDSAQTAPIRRCGSLTPVPDLLALLVLFAALHAGRVILEALPGALLVHATLEAQQDTVFTGLFGMGGPALCRSRLLKRQDRGGFHDHGTDHRWTGHHGFFNRGA